MKFFVKLILIVAVVIFGLINHKLIIGNKTVFSNKQPSGIQAIKTIAGTKNVYYYSNPFGSGYMVIVETNDRLLMTEASQQEIALMTVAGFFVSNLRPQEVAPIPWWVFGIGVVVIVLIMPSKK